MRTVLLAVLFFLAAVPTGWAQEVEKEKLSSSGPVSVPPPTVKALRYFQTGNILWGINKVWGVVVPGLFLFTGLSARMRNLAQKMGRNWFFAIGLYFLIFSVVSYLLNFPLNYYEGFIREHGYGLSTQSFGKWLGDSLKSLAITVIIGVLFLWIPYLLVAKSPRHWWFYTGLLMVPFLFLGLLVMPVWIEPLFNDFGELQNKHLKTKILDQASRAGIQTEQVYEVNKSVDTKVMNAYVTGFLNTKRIVLWDNLLQKLKDREILFVMGHEMGHYVLGHVVQGILFASFLILAALYLVHVTAGVLIRHFHRRFDFDRLADVASFPLFLLLIAIFSLFGTPLGLAFSRHLEHEADRFGLEITQDNYSAATSFVKFQQDDLGVPYPGQVYKIFRCSHPPLGERIDFCNDYHPWDKGEPLKYGSLFQPKK